MGKILVPVRMHKKGVSSWQMLHRDLSSLAEASMGKVGRLIAHKPTKGDSEMTRTSYYAGLDVHKETISFCVKTESGKLVKRGKMPARREAVKEFAETMPRPLAVAMEATMFSAWIADYLVDKVESVEIGHPLKLRAIATAKKKSDAIDAETLVDLRRCGFFPSCFMLPRELRDLRTVLRFRNLMVGIMVKMKNKTAGLLMSEGIEYSKRKLHGKRYFARLMEDLDDVPESMVSLLQLSRQGMEFFDGLQKRLRDGLVRHPALAQRVELLKTIPGVGDIMALTWALEIGDPSRFRTISQAVSYCGLCSALDSSAGKIKRGPLSKQRNALLQTTLIEIAKLGPMWNPQLKDTHDRAVEKGASHNEAAVEVARKLVAYLLAVDKSGVPFELKKT